METEYSCVLGFPSEGQTRKTFCRNRKQVHPDENLNAAEKFQVLSEAYQVLSDPVQTNACNEIGKHSVYRETMHDGKTVFAMIFGSDLFEDYIGHLALASMASTQLADKSEDPDKWYEKLKAIQKVREEILARFLKDFLGQYVCGDIKGFLQRAESEAKRLSHTAFGVDMLHTLGYIYSSEAGQELGKNAIYLGVPFLAEWVCYKGHAWKTKFAAVQGAYKFFRITEDMRKKSENHTPVPENVFDSHIKVTQKNCLWKFNVMDIETTVSHVCQMVLRENNVEKEELELRANALKILGKIFQEAKQVIIKLHVA